MVTPIQTVALNLSQEETWALLALLNIGGLPGCIPPSWDEWGPEPAAVLLGTAQNSLVAKGIIERAPDVTQPDGFRWQVDKTAAALVAAGALAEQVLTLIYDAGPALLQRAWVYFAPGWTVIHQLIPPTTHQFIAAQEGDLILNAVIRALKLRPDTQLVPGGFSLAQAELQRARDAASGGSPAQAQAILLANGLPEGIAEALADSLANPIAIARVIFTATRGGASTGFHVLESRDYYWLMTPAGDHFHLGTAALTDVTGRVVALVTGR